MTPLALTSWWRSVSSEERDLGLLEDPSILDPLLPLDERLPALRDRLAEAGVRLTESVSDETEKAALKQLDSITREIDSIVRMFCYAPTIDAFANDYDWRQAVLEANPPAQVHGSSVDITPFAMDGIAEVLRCCDGENDEREWVALLRLTDGRFVGMRAGCDYTGWDCQAGGSSHVAETLDDVARLGLTDEERKRLAVFAGGISLDRSAFLTCRSCLHVWRGEPVEIADALTAVVRERRRSRHLMAHELELREDDGR